MSTCTSSVLTLSIEGKPAPCVRKAALALTGLSQSQMAEQIGVSRQALSQVIAGRLRSERIENAFAEAVKLPRETLFPQKAA